MTNAERAVKIVETLKAIKFHLGHDNPGEAMEVLTAQLDEVAREATQNAIANFAIDKASFDKGFASAREQAAGICDKPVDEALVHRIPGYVLAARIRSMEPNR